MKEKRIAPLPKLTLDPEKGGKEEEEERQIITVSQNNWKIIKLLIIVMSVFLLVSIILNIVHAAQISSNKTDIESIDDELSTTKEELISTKSTYTTEIASALTSLSNEIKTTKSTLDTSIATANTDLSGKMSTTKSNLAANETDIDEEMAKVKTETAKMVNQGAAIKHLDISDKGNSEAITTIIGDIYFTWVVGAESTGGKVDMSWIVNSLVSPSSCKFSGTGISQTSISTKGTRSLSTLAEGVYVYTITCTSVDGPLISKSIYVPIPQLISSCAQLQAINTNKGKYYGLSDNIDCVGIPNFLPLGDSAAPFTGIITGFGHYIDHLTVDTSANNQGLIGVSSGCTVRDLILKNVDIGGAAGNEENIGTVVGENMGIIIDNTHVRTGSVRGQKEVGGLIGKCSTENMISNITNSSVDLAVIGDVNTGGLIGNSLYVIIKTSFSKGTVSANGDYSGGLIGWVQTPTEITDSYSAVQFLGIGTWKGGLLGKLLNYQLLRNCFFVGIITPLTNAGGVAAYSEDSNVGEGLFWDTTTSLLSVALNGDKLGDGYATAGMKDIATYVNYDFIAIWQDNDGGYPSLKWEVNIP